MLPFRDRIRSRTVPWLTWAIVAVNVAVFVYELSLGRALPDFMARHAVVPARFSDLPWADPAAWLAAAEPTLVSMFLHGGWLHLILNMWYLWVFGDNVEDRIGRVRYLFLYLASGAVGTLAHIWANPGSEIPIVGASGAIAGVLGAYLVTYPRVKVLTGIPVFVFIHIVELPAWLLLGLWFALQMLSGVAAISTTQISAGGVAWWAHIGGFAAGMVLMAALKLGKPDRHRRRRGSR
ncbi:MAG: rhomboid family intramembrane serine protease [Gemmatimonadetes bacterium]|nr:rhomboid family intramembrane serine protease [Gemmatimonadota bacterium]